MKKVKEVKQLTVAERMKMAEADGVKVAKILTDAREKANKILEKSGHFADITLNICKINSPDKEVLNG